MKPICHSGKKYDKIEIVDSEKLHDWAVENKRFRNHSWLIRFEPDDPFYYRKYVERFAYYFKRELGYDFCQYVAKFDKNNNHNCIPYLITDGVHNVIGGCCFRIRYAKNNTNPIPFLDWIWLHPYYRRCGILTHLWPYFKRAYGDDFRLEYPLSDGMKKFLEINKE